MAMSPSRAARLTSRRLAFFLSAVLAASAGSAVHAQTAPKPADAGGAMLEEVTVTATRRSEPLSKVAISVTAFGAEQMDERGVKDFDDLVRLSPGVNLTRSTYTGANRIAINGISSSAGSATTGVYIDDTPIMVRNLGFGAGDAFPGLFDIERVEVLRGPQGTLFGAGSEGGTIRFIQTEPSLTQQQTYVRSEVATLRYGSPTYEAGGAIGVPLIDNKLGLRISAFYRHEGGWIDGVDGSYQIVDPTGALYGNSVKFTRTQTIAEDINWNRTTALRASLKWAATDNLTVTPSVFYQKRHLNDGAGALYDLATSNLGNRDYSRQYYLIYPAGTSYNVGTAGQTLTLNAMNAPNNAFGDDQFTLSSIAVSWDLGAMQLVSNTSYFDRTSVQWYDYTKGYVQYYVPEWFSAADGSSTGDYPPLGWKSMARYDNAQGNFVQEIRLQSKDATARLSWVAGAFYSRDRQSAAEPINQNFLINSPWVGFYPTALGYGYYGVDGGYPFGPGYTAAQNFFGDTMLPNAVSFLGTWRSVEEQLAGFLQFDYTIVGGLKATAGVRVSHNTLDFNAAYLGPENNANAPFGGSNADCTTHLPSGYCAYGSGELAPSYPVSSSHSAETAVTPKFGLAYQINDRNLLYATAAKGFRPAGASLRVPSICNYDLVQNGYVDANGNPIQPTTYKSDSVWSYEVGSKNRVLGGRLQLDSSAYIIKWRNIQSNVSLPNCSYNFVDNLADATSKGFNFDFTWKLTDRLDLSGSFALNDPSFDRDAKSPGGKVIYNGGSSIPEAGPPTAITLSAMYTLPFGGERSGYARVDYNRSGEWRRYGTTDPGTPYYDSRLPPIPAYDVLNLRFGYRFGNADLSLFVNNLQDRAPHLGMSSSTYYDPQDWQDVTLRPRTYGLTLTYRR
jgi:outer membrane receptor protein involved in Fe transport